MGWNEALQGLVGGLSSGVGGIMSQRQQAQENEQKQRAIAVQEAEAKRLQQVSEWEQQKAAYEALTGEVSPDDPVVKSMIGKLPFVKGPNGGIMRPPTVQEQKGLKDIDLGFQGQLATAQYAPQAESAKTIQELRNIQDQAGLDNAIKIAQGNNATARYGADKSYDARLAANEAMTQRSLMTAQNRPLNEDDYMMWAYTFKKNNPDKYNEVLRQYGPQQTDQFMREAAAYARTPLIK